MKDVAHAVVCPTCCWLCDRRKGMAALKMEPRRLQLLPPAPKGCPAGNFPCQVSPGSPQCTGPKGCCNPCSGWKKAKP